MDNITFNNLSLKHKTILISSFTNMIFMFILFIISTPNKEFSEIDKDICNNITEIKVNEGNTGNTDNNYNLTEVVCKCNDAIINLNIFRYSYNIVGIGCMVLIFITIKREFCLTMSFMVLIMFMCSNFLAGNIINSSLNGYYSFCYYGIYNLNPRLLTNYLINFWIIIIFMTIGVLYLIIYCLNTHGCFGCLNCNYCITLNQQEQLRQEPLINNHDILPLYSSDTSGNSDLPVYQERECDLPSYQETINTIHININNNDNELPSYSSINNT